MCQDVCQPQQGRTKRARERRSHAARRCQAGHHQRFSHDPYIGDEVGEQVWSSEPRQVDRGCRPGSQPACTRGTTSGPEPARSLGQVHAHGYGGWPLPCWAYFWTPLDRPDQPKLALGTSHSEFVVRMNGAALLDVVG